MKKLVVIVLVLFVSVPSFTFAAQIDTPHQHLREIAKLAKVLADKDFEPITVVAKGASREEAMFRAARDICDHVDLRSLSPALCKCINKVIFIPNEACVLLEKLSNKVVETVNDDDSVTLVIELGASQLKQLAYFEMWPLFERRLRPNRSS